MADTDDRCPKKASSHNNLAQSLLNQRKFNDAESHAEKAIELDPDNEKGYFRAAKAAEGQKDFQRATRYLKRGLERKKLAQNSNLLKSLADLQKKMNYDTSDDSEVEEEEDVVPKHKTPTKKVVKREPLTVPSSKMGDMASIQPAAKKGPIDFSKGDSFIDLAQEVCKEQIAGNKLSFAQQKIKRKKTDYEQAILEAAELLLKKQQNVTAALKYQEALDIIIEYPAESIGLSSMTETVLKYCIVMCWCKSVHVTLEQMSRSVEYLAKIRKVHPAERFPAVFYGYAKVYSKLNRFNRSKELAQAGLDVLKKEPLIQIHFWPGSKTEIPETTRFGLEAGLLEMIAECSVFHPPDAICRNPEADCFRLSKQIIPSRHIYFSDVDFLGFMEVHCQSKCVIEYHISCWRDFKDMQSQLLGNKLTDKDILGLPCPTDDCTSPDGTPSTITYIAQLGDKRVPKFTVVKEIVKEKAPKKKIETTKTVSSLKAPAVTKPKPVARVQPADKVPEKASTAANDDCAPYGSDDTQALSIAMDDFLELRKRNFNYRKSQIWDVSKPFYGRSDLLPDDFFRTPRKKDDSRDFVMTLFRETLSQRSPMLVSDVEELWNESAEEIPALVELENGEDFPGIINYLAESYQFIVIGDTMCLAKDLDSVFAQCCSVTAECVQFVIEEDAKKSTETAFSGRSSAVSLPWADHDAKEPERAASEISLPLSGQRSRSRLDSARSVLSAVSDDGAKCLELLHEAGDKGDGVVTPSKRAKKKQSKASKQAAASLELETGVACDVTDELATVLLPRKIEAASSGNSPERPEAKSAGAALVLVPVAKTPNKRNRNLELAFDKLVDDHHDLIRSESPRVVKTPTNNEKMSELFNVTLSRNDGVEAVAVDSPKAVKASGKKKLADLSVGLPAPVDSMKSFSFLGPALKSEADLKSIQESSSVPVKTPKKKKKQSESTKNETVVPSEIETRNEPEQTHKSVENMPNSVGTVETVGVVLQPSVKDNAKSFDNVHLSALNATDLESYLRTFLPKQTDDTQNISEIAATFNDAPEESTRVAQEKLVVASYFMDAEVRTSPIAEAVFVADATKDFSDVGTNTAPEEFTFGVQSSDKPRVCDGEVQTEMRASAISANEAKIVNLTKEFELMHQRVKNSDEITSVLLDNRKALERRIDELEIASANKDEEIARLAKTTAATEGDKSVNLLLEKAKLDLENENLTLSEELLKSVDSRNETEAQLETAHNEILSLSQQLHDTKESLKTSESVHKTIADALHKTIRDVTALKNSNEALKAENAEYKSSLEKTVVLHKRVGENIAKLEKENEMIKANLAEMVLKAEAERAEAAKVLKKEAENIRHQAILEKSEKENEKKMAALGVTEWKNDRDHREMLPNETLKGEIARYKSAIESNAVSQKKASENIAKLERENVKLRSASEKSKAALVEMTLVAEALKKERGDGKEQSPPAELEALEATRRKLEKAEAANKQLQSRLLTSQQATESLTMRLNYSADARPVETDSAVLFNNFVLIHKELGQIKADRCNTEFTRVLKLLDDAQENRLVAEDKKQTLWEMRAVLGEIYQQLLESNDRSAAMYNEFLNNPGKVGRIEDLPLMGSAQISDEVYAALVDVEENCRQEEGANEALPKPEGPTVDDRRKASQLMALRNAPNKFMSRPPPLLMPQFTVFPNHHGYPMRQPAPGRNDFRMPGHGMPGNGMPGPGMSGNGMHGNRMPGPGMPGNGMPGPGMPGNGMHGNRMPGPGMPGNGMPGPGMPGNGMPGPGMHGNGMPVFPMQGQPHMNGNQLQGLPLFPRPGAVAMGPNLIHMLNRPVPPSTPPPPAGARPKRSVSQSSVNSADSDHSQRGGSRKDEARTLAANTLTKASKPSAGVGQTLGDMSAYDSLMKMLTNHFPNNSVHELNECLGELRQANYGSLKGFPPPAIVKKIKAMLHSKSQKPAWAPVSGAEGDGAGKWRNPLEDPECAICMDVMRPPTDTTSLPCDHIFHAQCIKKWLSINSVCPNCKRHTKTDDEYPPLK